LDASRWQSVIDWKKVKASGLVSGVMLKTVSTNDNFS
jgi:GH25 family lysozyme M1 (1,4-beta-N-acetylmuramidase)